MVNLTKKSFRRIRSLIYKNQKLDKNIKKLLMRFPSLAIKLKTMLHDPLPARVEEVCHQFRFPLAKDIHTLSPRAKKTFDTLKNDKE